MAKELTEQEMQEKGLLKCPYCKQILGYADCPDLFASEDDEDLEEQEDLLFEMQRAGYNVVVCGDCGQVFLHRT